MKYLVTVLALLMVSMPLRSAQAMMHFGIQCGPYRFAGVWNKKDRFIYWRVNKHWEDIVPYVRVNINQDIISKENYRYRGHKCHPVDLLTNGKPVWTAWCPAPEFYDGKWYDACM